MKLFNNNIVPYASTEGDKIYPIVVDIKKGIKSGEAISFVTADNQVGVITVDFMDGNSSYSIEGCMVTSTIRRPDGTVLEIPCDIISQSTIEIPLGINGTYQEGVHTFDLKIVRGNGKVIGVPTMSYSVSGSLSSDGVVEGDDRLPVLTMVLDNAQDKLTRLDRAIAGATNDLEVKEARDGEVTLNARLERDLEKGKIHFVECSGECISTESEEGYLENVEIHGNTWQNAENLADIRSVGTKVEGQELYEIDVVSCGKNLFDGIYNDNSFLQVTGGSIGDLGYVSGHKATLNYVKLKPNSTYKFSTSNSQGVGIILFFYDKNKKYIRHIDTHIMPYTTLTTNENDYYIRWYGTDAKISNFTDVQIEEGTKATPYEPYQEDKLTILSPTPLEKVGDVADRVICKNEVWGVEKNIGEVTIDGDSEVVYWVKGDTTVGVLCRDSRIINTANLDKVNAYCNILPSTIPRGFTSRDEEGVCVWDKNNQISIKVLKSKLSSEDTLGVKQWLQDNNAKIMYPLAEPQFIPLPHDQQVKLRTFAGQTNIHFETEIEPTLKASVPKSLGATVNTHTTQIDNLNKELDRVKKLEESTVTTVTTDSSFTTVSETTQGYFEDVKIEGKTLVNLCGKVLSKPGFVNVTGDIVTFNVTQHAGAITYDVSMLKPSTVYTLIGIGIDVKQDISFDLFPDTFTELGNVTKENPIKISRFTTPSNINDLASLRQYVSLGVTETTKLYKPVILEGDHTDKDISYFEGLKSVGQDTDEISVLSVNENLVDLYEFKNKCVSGVEEGSTIKVSGNVIKFTPQKTYAGIMCKVNTEIGKTYYINCVANGCRIAIHPCSHDIDSPTSYFPFRDNSICVRSFVATEKYTYIVIDSDTTTEKVVEKLVISVNENSNTINKQDKKQILYYNPTTQTWEKPVLREWDSIEKHSDGKYYYHKRSEEIVFNGSENWFKGTIKQITQVFSIAFRQASFTTPINDKFPMNVDGDVEKIVIADNNTGVAHMYYAINKSKLSTQDATGFKQWLQANPTTVVYQLAQEEVYECTNLDLITYSGETNLIVNSGAIQPKITLKVLSNVSNVVKLLQEKVSILENKFIKGLQQVLAGDMMSLAHLLYPEDFGNNHEIQTLEL